MGVCIAPVKRTGTPEELESKKVSERIDKDLKASAEQNHVRILLTGTADAGKSTFLRQLLLEYGTNQQELDTIAQESVEVLRDNVVSVVKDVVAFAKANDQTLTGCSDKDLAKIERASTLNDEIVKIIVKIRDIPSFQTILESHGEVMHVQGGVTGATYFLQNVERFAAEDFAPTRTDMIFLRKRTRGTNEIHFKYKSVMFTLVDVGGQRSERRTWLQCFSDVTGIIYLVALNEYDLFLEEDERTNRLAESLKVWRALSTSVYLSSIPFLLFLNKSDLFEEKIKRVPLSKVFSDFDEVVASWKDASLTTMEKSWKYIAGLFKQRYGGGKELHIHLTCAIDTEACKNLFDSVQKSLLTDLLSNNSFFASV